MSRKVALVIGAIAAVAILIALWRLPIQHWLAIHTGTDNESAGFYGFWSGFGSDIGEATIVVGIIGAYRHHNCHVKGCLFLGQKVEGTSYLACPRHHPAHKGSKRGVSVDTIHEEHRNRIVR